MAVACGGLALMASAEPIAIVALAALAAAVTAAARAFAGSSPAATLASCAAALVLALWLGELRAAPRGPFAAAAAPIPVGPRAPTPTAHASPLPALGAAFAAAALDPSFVGLIAISGVRFVRGPWTRPRWSFALPALGVIAIALAVAGAVAANELWLHWVGRSGHAGAPA